MPELPEVHTIVNDLKKTIVGYTIAQVWVAEKYYKIQDSAAFTAKVKGKIVINVTRIAKNILVELDSGDYIHIHLAMTGRVFILDPKKTKGQAAHVVFRLKSSSDNKLMTFTDVRTFGKVALINPQELQTLHDKYGIEPISPVIDKEKLYNSLKKKKTIIKNILMDQSLIAGLGNIYATDALFMAGINPKTKMNKITFEEFSRLMDAASEILKLGIQNRGSTLPDKMYVDIWGLPGKQQEHFKVYSRTKCVKCEGKISFEKIAGRGTYYCPNCQPIKE